LIDFAFAEQMNPSASVQLRYCMVDGRLENAVATKRLNDLSVAEKI